LTRRRLIDLLWLLALTLWIIGLAFLTEWSYHRVPAGLVGILVVVTTSIIAVLSCTAALSLSPGMRASRLQAQEMQAFCRAIKRASGTLELQQIIDSAAVVVVEVTGVRGCTIKLLDTQTQRMKARSIVGIDEGQVSTAVRMADSLYQLRMMRREPIIVRDIELRDFPAVNEAFESMVCVPLQLEDKILGAICVFGAKGQRLSEEMITLLSTLGDVISLAVAHAQVYQDLKDLVEIKTRFMLQTSHELRSPLDSIRSMARTLLGGYLGELSAEQKKMLERIDLRSGMLAEIVGDLLVLAQGRAELSTLEPEVVDVSALMKEVMELLSLTAQEKGVTLARPHDIASKKISGSRDGIRSVMINLIANAIKYTPPDGCVTVRLSGCENQVLFEVADTGIGIPEEECASLFSEFFRASNAKAAAESGTGLGLAIVKTIVEQHGGSVEVTSELGRGSVFRVTFPAVSTP
jgi:two-component system phosphate regulon sensor histidine kinase PhoR